VILREQGVDLIVVFVAERVRLIPDNEKQALAGGLTLCARSAGLAGQVVLVWPGGFFGDRNFHAYFRDAPYEFLVANINKRLSCPNP
jgi:hypothetical protein